MHLWYHKINKMPVKTTGLIHKTINNINKNAGLTATGNLTFCIKKYITF